MAEKKCEEATRSGVAKEGCAGSVVKKCLQSVKVSKHDATQLQQKLQKEVFEHFSEKYEVMTNTKIPFSTFNAYMDFLQQTYDVIDCRARKIIDTALFQDKSWDSKIVEWTNRRSDNSGAEYNMIAFGRYHNQQNFDVMLISYTMEYVLNTRVDANTKEQAWFKRVNSKSSDDDAFASRPLNAGFLKPMQNFLRVKALEGFLKEGKIESITYVNSLDDIPDTPAE